MLALNEKWIDVNTRLPEEGEKVLCTYKHHYPEPLGGIWVDVGEIAKGSAWMWTTVEGSIEVIAWMPLPKPYKETK